MQQLHPQIAGQLGKMARILVHALVGIDADGAFTGQARGAAGLQPLAYQIEHQAFAQFQFQHFGQPALPHIQHQQAEGDDAEYAELDQELPEIAMRQRIVERLVPAVQPDLAIGGGDDDDKHRPAQDKKLIAHRRIQQGADHHAHLGQQARTGIGLSLGGRSINMRQEAWRGLQWRGRGRLNMVRQDLGRHV